MVQGRFFQYFIASAVSLATTTIGVSSLWTTTSMPKLKNNETSIVMTDREISWMVSLSPVGFMLGSLATRFICDQLGRRSTILFSAVFMGTGTIIAATANRAWWLYIMMLSWGFGTGMISTAVTMYIAEIADKDIRGRLDVGTRFMFNFGGLLIMCVGAVASYDLTNYLVLVLPVVYFTAAIGIPESPYFYLMKGRNVRATKVLARLRGTDEGLDEELERMVSHVNKDMSSSTSTMELLRGKQYRKAVIIAVGLKMVQIMSGTQTVQVYLGVIMKESGTKLSLTKIYIIFGAIKFLVGIMSSLLADRVGRRPLLINSFLGCGICNTIVGFYFLLLEVVKVDHTSIQPYGFIPFMFVVASNGISTLGFNSIAGVVQGEVFPINVKAVAITSLNIYGGVLGFTTARLFQVVKDVGGLFCVFSMYAAITLIGTLFSYFTIPETKGKSLREIQAMLRGEENDGQVMKSMNYIKDEETVELNGGKA